MIWAFHSDKAGEERQIMALARATSARFGCPLQMVRLRHRGSFHLLALTRGVGFEGLIEESKTKLVAPWPKVIITAGFVHEPVARKIKALSGDETKIIVVGRPWAGFEHFDLVVTTPQYRLPALPNILQNLTTLHSYTRVSLKKESMKAKTLWPSLSPPFVSVLIGGRSGPYQFGVHAARRLAEGLNHMATELGATLLISTSSRTNVKSIWVLESALKVPYKMHVYQAYKGENPYPVMLGAAAAIVVGGDSVAMLSEAVASGHPVYIFDTGAGTRTMQPGFRSGPMDRSFGTELYRLMMLFGPRRLSRDIALVHHLLVDARHACWFGDTPTSSMKPLPPNSLEDTLDWISPWF